MEVQQNMSVIVSEITTVHFGEMALKR